MDFGAEYGQNTTLSGILYNISGQAVNCFTEVGKKIFFCRKYHRAARPVRARGAKMPETYQRFSASCSQSAAEASEGIRQSARGERETEPTLTPSGMQLRLNCCEKNRR